ncbi:MAG: hypothetical protein WCX73_03190 [Candidatus Pacearchaeota archaeon]
MFWEIRNIYRVLKLNPLMDLVNEIGDLESNIKKIHRFYQEAIITNQPSLASDFADQIYELGFKRYKLLTELAHYLDKTIKNIKPYNTEFTIKKLEDYKIRLIPVLKDQKKKLKDLEDLLYNQRLQIFLK